MYPSNPLINQLLAHYQEIQHHDCFHVNIHHLPLVETSHSI